LHPGAKSQLLFWVSSKSGNAPEMDGNFEQIMIRVKTQIPVRALLFFGDTRMTFHDWV
jgi:hypothetical protein